MLELWPLTTAQLLGSTPNPRSWLIRGQLVGPTGTLLVDAPAEACLIFLRNPAPPRVREGTSILPAVTSRLLWSAERRAADLLASPFGMNLHYQAQGASTDQSKRMAEQVLSNFPSASGDLIVSFSNAAYEQSRTNLGGDIAEDVNASVNSAAEYAAASIRAAALVPPALMTISDSGQMTGGQSEALSHFLEVAARPMAQLLADELTLKLEAPVTIDLPAGTPSDIRARARAISDLVGAGMALDQATEWAER